MNLKEHIQNRLTGTEFVKLRDLHTYMLDRGYLLSERQLRQTIAEMQASDGVIIISGQRGYKLAQTVKEYEEALRYYNSYIYSLLRKRKAIKQTYIRLMKPQLF
jgi:hypothetical protein